MFVLSLPSVSLDDLLGLFSEQPELIQVIWAAIAFFLFLLVAFINLIIGSRIYKTIIQLRKASLRKRYEELLTSYIFSDEEDIDTLELFRKKYLDKEFNRSVLIDEILLLHKDLSGDVRQKLRELYRKLELHKDSFKKLSSFEWHLKARGIKELSQMQVKEAFESIKRYINDPMPFIRMEAQLGLVLISEDHFLYFLKDLKYPLSEWQQLNIHRLLMDLDKDQVPQFEQWLASSNSSVVRFSLMMVRSFNQVEAGNAIINLLSHDEETVKIDAIKTLTEIQCFQAGEELKRIYRSETSEVQTEILRFFEAVGSEEDVQFLEDKFCNDYAIDFPVTKALLNFKSSDDIIADNQHRCTPIMEYVRHLSDKRI